MSSSARALPDELGHFDFFGGQFVPEALKAALEELTAAFRDAQDDPSFAEELKDLQVNYAGRPSPITEARNFGDKYCGGARILLKREDLNHTGSHKINNVLGQGLLTRRMGKKRVIAETGAGQHGVATATIAALMGFQCRIYMGKVDTDRQALNVARMQLLGAEVVAVEAGSATLKDAMNEALRDWVTNVATTHYLIGTASGPHPFPMMVREFQRIISTESRAQMLQRFSQLPDAICACVGGGSNAIGSFADYIPDENVALYGFEAGGEGVETGRHAASINGGSLGVLHGTRTFVLQDDDGQTIESHSISAGLDYPGVGPEHAYLSRTGRAHYEPVNDDEAMEALDHLTRCEGIMPAIESAHAVAGAERVAKRMLAENPDHRPTLLVTISGRGDKDVDTAMKYFGVRGTVDATTGSMS
ncbi:MULTISPECIES: tryptophan synthase subunit beta [Propionibacterium]|uniref:tryptophan synthase subunit beta n=1 Tax=Propionibacterium TaxID=1743 RepID=UPI0005A5C7C0|nr:tryptophan synthase subunit beta [Propionibacterium freudenreichii]MCT2998209.1 tryptophan synthase subunit beta [Propionibacterium freudenreichii]MCT3002138.1 tryptophan synthase subunit beta [Propionibacterium freudenreichii]MDK9330796.1 tryptophan synthase subunit beta [Propionibacterium freudenreichii]MDK9345641.1 tryptophan synthase subunit beta [Propionibacterium freudenreichii]MDK9662509.1 tryptophan synthase subunit beta [Propionibacterium freudenreichii]